MKSVILLDVNYAHANQISSKLDWNGLGLSVLTEYSEWNWTERGAGLNPDLVIVGKTMFFSLQELMEPLLETQQCITVILVDSSMQTDGLPEKVRIMSCCMAELTEAFVQQAMEVQEREKAVETVRYNDTSTELQKLSGIHISAAEVYVLRLLPRNETTHISLEKMGRIITRTFESLLIDWFREDSGSYCVVIRNTPEVSILYSVQVIGNMLRLLRELCKDCGYLLKPLLISEKISKKEVLPSYLKLKELETLCYFCQEKPLLMEKQLQEKRILPDYDHLDTLIHRLRNGLLTGNFMLTLQLIEQIYLHTIKPTLDWKYLLCAREQLAVVFTIYGMIRKRESCFPQNFPTFQSLEAEQMYVQGLITEHCADMSDPCPVHDKTVAAIQYIHENYQRDFSQEDISGYLGLSPSYFSRLFKKDTGTGYVEYLMQLRLTQAKKRFDAGQRNVQQVALSVGIQDPKYFSRIFRREYGLSPAQYLAERAEGSADA